MKADCTNGIDFEVCELLRNDNMVMFAHAAAINS